MSRLSLALAAALLVAAARSAAAQDTPAEPPRPPVQLTPEELLFERKEVVTSAARREQPISRSSAATVVITAEEIRLSGAQNLADLLRSVAGVSVIRIGAPDANVNVRGLNNNSDALLLLLIDGRSAMLDFFSVVLWEHLPLVLEEIERIEVVRGPASPLYGPNAFSGVVNVITRKPEACRGARAGLMAGNRDAKAGTLVAAERIGPFWVKLSAGYDSINHYPNRVDPAYLSAADPIALERRAKDTGSENMKAMLRADWAEVEGLRVSLRGGWNRSTTTYLLTSDTTYEGTNGDHGYLQLDAALDRKESVVRLNAYARRENYPVRTIFRTVGGPTWELRETIENVAYDVEAQRSVRPFEGNVLTYGLSGRASYAAGRRIFGDRERTLIGSLFIQDEYQIVPGLDLSGSVRWDNHSEAGASVSPRGSLVASPFAGHVFRALVGQAYLNPDNVQNFTTLEIPTNLPSPSPPTLTVTGDEDLDPQRQVTFELDYETTAIPGAVLETSVFYEVIDDLIVFVPPPTTEPDNYLNSGRIELYGGEASANLRFAPWLRGFVNYAYVHVNNTYRWVSPKHQVNVGARVYPAAGVSLSATLHWTSKHRFSGLAAMPADRDLPGGVWVQGRIAYETGRGEVGTGEAALWFLAGETRREFPRGDEIGYRFGFTVGWRL